MRRIGMVIGGTALALGGLLAPRPAPAEPTKYCAARIEEAEDTVKTLEETLDRVKDAQDKQDIQAWVGQAKQYITVAKAAAQEDDCVKQVELAKTLTQDAISLAAQTQ